ncbi:peptidylprolyl isomerase [Dongia sp.]|uniref:peptidylprolyl isomerase n=1 Tax=Dongia sp. TaxID=1977262 RepID=UPI003750627F
MPREELKIHDVPADKLQGLTQCVMTTSKGDITIDLFPKEAPNTVANFYTLAADGFYDGLSFHRVIPGFVAQGGCPDGTGAGGPGWVIPCETKGNPHKHKTGSLSMAHRGKDTGGSQFFLVLAPQPHLDGLHTVFGQVSKGLEVMQDLEIGDEIKSVKFTGH